MVSNVWLINLDAKSSGRSYLSPYIASASSCVEKAGPSPSSGAMLGIAILSPRLPPSSSPKMYSASIPQGPSFFPTFKASVHHGSDLLGGPPSGGGRPPPIDLTILLAVGSSGSVLGNGSLSIRLYFSAKSKILASRPYLYGVSCPIVLLNMSTSSCGIFCNAS